MLETRFWGRILAYAYNILEQHPREQDSTCDDYGGGLEVMSQALSKDDWGKLGCHW